METKDNLEQDNLDLVALDAAKRHMGDVAWPTVILGIAVTLGYLATPLLVVAGMLPLLAAIPLMAFFTYAAYTVLHDAAHGSISGSNGGLRWLNETMGYVAAWILMLPLKASGTTGVPGVGTLRIPIQIPNDPRLIALNFDFQAVALDPGSPGGVAAASDGLDVVICSAVK